MPGLFVFIAAVTAFAADTPSAAEKTAVAEMEARILKLKAEGKLPDGPEPSPKTAVSTNAPGCNRLAVGQSVVINEADDTSPTGTAAHYGLSRPEENLFLVEINPRFVKGPGYVKDETAEALNEKYRTLMKKCLKEYEGKLKDEKAKASLTLRLTENSSVPLVTIEIMPDDFRSSRFRYEANISCPVVLHELLHLLGLPDEYPHKPGLTEVYLDCRPASPSDSVMGSQWNAVNAVLSQMGYAIEKCKCEKPGIACWELAAKANGKTCPSGSSSFFEKLDPTIKTSLNVLNSNESFVLDVGKMKEIGFQPPEKSSVLYSAHFRAITQPGCRDVNESYYSCSQNAYRFSKPAGAADLGDPALGCKPTPEACRWRSFKWLE